MNNNSLEAHKVYMSFEKLNNQKVVKVVKDLKKGENTEGGVGLWVDIGTEGFFKDLKIIKHL